jgi:hypothetical protein
MNLTIWRLGGLKEQRGKQKRVVVAVKHGIKNQSIKLELKHSNKFFISNFIISIPL